ncbi:TadE/TadG family type IV pilus assembly protein [Agromyces albus]|uniref:Putative Flp pilus-assembly TadG-like N-terminal domain-containing protein n=1 Tax=Agromyces albus TaxID=205332 RepID=A0A4Q2L6T4_9MICO|nr:pilus assembly protein TadG-related protein [Agromyces albus]RXZ72680.1 hypothetical protein ESP51_02425 [Agromyces albus]
MPMMAKHFMRLVRDERGANAVLITFLLIPMMGFGALAFDVSAQHAERTQLQLGADAAALAVARSCGIDETTCAGTAQTVADGFVAGNGGTFPGAAEAPVIDFGKRQATVTTAADFPHFFASLIDGDGDPSHTRVAARATAEWEEGTAATVVPFAIGECSVPSGTGSVEFIPIDNDPCSGSVPGGFGWLDDGTDSCIKDVTLGDFTTITTGNTGKCDLTDAELASAAAQIGCSLSSLPGKPKSNVEKLFACFVGRTILVPVYSLASECEGTPPAGKSYCISKFAAFDIIGIHVKVNGSDQVDACESGETCHLPKDWGSLGFEGRFISYVTPEDSWVLGPPNPVILLIE